MHALCATQVSRRHLLVLPTYDMLTTCPPPACSIKVLEPLLTEPMRAHPAWASWVKLVQLFTLAVQHELKVTDIELLDDYQVEHATLFAAVPEYAGLSRPKHHFLTHLPGDAWRYGPPRGYMCFGFEGFNKVIKSGAARSNWQRESLTIMRYWSLYHARLLVAKRRREVTCNSLSK